ncbi:MAG: hypothetical protein ACYTHJ_18020 [Planctomycetota bacterium]|jgi:hypothetical protein
MLALSANKLNSAFRPAGRLICLISALASCTGCTSDGGWIPISRGASAAHDEPDDTAPEGGSQALQPVANTPNSDPGTWQLSYDVLRVELPTHAIRHSQKIWNHVDSLRINSDVAARLARNGLRVGVATSESWPAIETIIQAAEGTIAQTSLASQFGLPVSLKLGEIKDSETLFSYDNDNRLVGKTFQVGEKLLSISSRYQPNLGSGVQVELEFEIRHDPGDFKWDRTDQGIRPVPVIERHVFSSVSVPLTMAPGEVLIVGPSEAAGNEYLLGGRFFDVIREGVSKETIICLSAAIAGRQTGEITRR